MTALSDPLIGRTLAFVYGAFAVGVLVLAVVVATHYRKGKGKP